MRHQLSSSPTKMLNHIACLDHGFVELIDRMPREKTESAIVHAARTSTCINRESQIRTIDEDTRLIKYLYRNGHTSPFESVKFKFCLKCPIFVARQIMRHRTANINEISGRYSQLDECWYNPWQIKDDQCPGGGIRLQNNKNKQGSMEGHTNTDVESLQERLNAAMNNVFDLYKEMIQAGIAREVARYCLPVATYTQLYFTMDLHNLLNFLRLRIDAHAQAETRVFAQAMFDLICPIVPVTITCFKKYTIECITLNADEIEAIRSGNKELKTTKAEQDNFTLKCQRLNI